MSRKMGATFLYLAELPSLQHSSRCGEREYLTRGTLEHHALSFNRHRTPLLFAQIAIRISHARSKWALRRRENKEPFIPSPHIQLLYLFQAIKRRSVGPNRKEKEKLLSIGWEIKELASLVSLSLLQWRYFTFNLSRLPPPSLTPQKIQLVAGEDL